MGCCNKKHTGKPISRRRYYGGLVILGGAQLGAMALVHGLAVPFPRYRKMLPFARQYAKDTVKSAMARERIVVDGWDPVEDEVCEWEPGAVPGADDWTPAEDDAAWEPVSFQWAPA